jgi:MFS family permease
MTARHSFLVQMIEDRNDLGNAIALNSSMVNGGRLIGPAIAGAVIVAAGEGWCFLIDGVSYLAVIASLLLMRIEANVPLGDPGSVLRQVREGWDYVRAYRPIRTILLMFALICLMGWPYSVLLPVFASEVLHGGAHTLGLLTGASGAGALISALSLAMRKSVVGLTRMIQIAAMVFGGALVVFGLSHVLWLSLALMVVVGFGMMQCASACNTVIQSLVTDDKRARAMSYYTMAFFGAAPIGSLLAGVLAQEIGAPLTVSLTGAICVAGSLWFKHELPKIGAAMKPVRREPDLLTMQPKGKPT